MSRRVRNVRRVAVAMTLVAVLGATAAPVAHAKPGSTTPSGKKWK